jgi:hypothetical protein
MEDIASKEGRRPGCSPAMARLRRSRAVWGAGAGLVILGLAIAVWKIVTRDSQTALVVDLGYASYRGQSLDNGVSHWLGMRYAAPPVGDLRFAAPQDPPSVQGTQDAVTVCLSTISRRGETHADIVGHSMDQYASPPRRIPSPQTTRRIVSSSTCMRRPPRSTGPNSPSLCTFRAADTT